METLAKHGFLVARSSRSRGPYDVWAIGDNGIYLIQVKRTAVAGRKNHGATVGRLGKLPKGGDKCHRQLWCWVDRKNWWVIDILDDAEPIGRWMDDEYEYQRIAGVRGLPKEQLDLALETNPN